MPISNTQVERLVLWDVDHTLIDTGGVGRAVFADAFRVMTGRDMGRLADVSGRTEPVILADTLELHGIDASNVPFERFSELQAQGYRERAAEMRQRGRTLPGATEALAAVAELPTVVQSVLTGNTRPAAYVKLETFGLAGYIDFDAGAYGADAPTRSRLVAIAQRRAAARYGAQFDERTTVLIGDTPSDVQAGLEGGALVVAVASGNSMINDLIDAGANAVLPDLTNLQALIRAATGRITHASG